MDNRRPATRLWLVPVVAIVLLSYVVPFTVLRGVDAWYGSTLFWTLATVVVIAINAVASAPWKD